MSVTTGKVSHGNRAIGLMILANAVLLAGCVQLEAPDKPIVINLNIAIRQEVVYRLDGRAQELIQSEADIF